MIMIKKLLAWFAPRPSPLAPQLVLRGMTDSELRAAFAGATDSGLFKATLEQCDQLLFETVNDLVNEAEQLNDGQVRQRVGELRGITQLRERLTDREAQARKDRAGQDTDPTE